MSKKYMLRFIFGLSLVLVLGPVSAYGEGVPGAASVQFSESDPNLGVLHPETQKPTDPGEVAKTEGPLRIDFAPQLTFETSELTNSGTEIRSSATAQLFHNADPSGHFVQVSDYRDTNSGWTLMVRQESQFVHESKSGVQLKGSVISFDSSWANSTKDASLAPTVSKETIQMNNIGESYPLASAGEGQGMGTWSINFGASSANSLGQVDTLEAITDAAGNPITDATYENQQLYRNTAVNLTIPKTNDLVSGNYSTVLTWILAELP